MPALNSRRHPKDSFDDDVAITGISGRFPECDTIEEFKKHLFAGTDLVTDDSRRWPSGLHGLPTRTGKIKDLRHFDAAFFGVLPKQANFMDPQMRMLLELAYEAIVDAGVNPADIRGSKTGVFVGVYSSDSLEYWNDEADEITGYAIFGCAKALLANKISYTFDLTGPSYAVDTACASSITALQHAASAIKNGDCDAAIVGGVNLVLKPESSLQFHRLGMLSPEGKCKSFDAARDGFVRSEAAVAIFLQRARVARRIYATVLGAKSNVDGYKEKGMAHPSAVRQNQLFREVFEEIGIAPQEVRYVEAHGTGTKVGDLQEGQSIAEFFCKNRATPLLMGSVKSNMGHAEAASGLCSLAKVLIAMEAGSIPRNLHFQAPNPKIPALLDGRLKVVTRNEPWSGGVVAINSFGFGGANTHVVLRSHSKPKSKARATGIPRLVGVSGRTEQAVKRFLANVELSSDDAEFLALLDEIHKNNIKGHAYRGYAVLDKLSVSEIVQVPRDGRPAVFIYSGMGAQWPGMAKELMRFECFQSSVTKCAEALKPKGLDLEAILTDKSESALDNFVHSFVAITAMHVALTDLLKTLCIAPDLIIGHSIGEIGCAYADGALTREQAILAAYYRGCAILHTELPPGAMAAVGLSLEETKRRCPPDIVPACHNCIDDVTVAGPAEVKVKELRKEGIPAKEVNISGRAFHSKYVAGAGQKLLEGLQGIIPSPVARSARWISSSIPESDWGTPLARYCSAAYHVNNLLSPVLFREALEHVPDEAIVVEIDSGGLLRAILKRALGIGATVISLLQQGGRDNVYFLSAIGKLFNAGAQPRFGNLYDPVYFPVGKGTRMINSLIEWDHSVEWAVPDFSEKRNRSEGAVFKVNLNNESDRYLAGHSVDGRILFPVTGYLTLVWKSFAKLKGTHFERLPVELTDVRFHRATIIPENGPVEFLVDISAATGVFQICESGSVAVSGTISVPEKVSMEPDLSRNIMSEPDVLNLTSPDIYKELRLRGYHYDGVFRGIRESDNRGMKGKLAWNNNWISFLDTVLQFSILGETTRKLYLPVGLQRAYMNPREHLNFVQKLPRGENVPVDMYRNIGVVKSPGIQLSGITFSAAQRRKQIQAAPKLEKYQFVPYENAQPLAKTQALAVILQTVLENSPISGNLKIYEVVTDARVEPLLAPFIEDIAEREPMTSPEVLDITVVDARSSASFSPTDTFKRVLQKINGRPIAQDAHLIVASGILGNDQRDVLLNAVASLIKGGFILLEENSESIDEGELCGLDVVSKQLAGKKVYLLLRVPVAPPADASVVRVDGQGFKWVEQLKESMMRAENDGRTIYIYSQGDEFSGIVGLVNSLRKEPGGARVRSVFIRDSDAPEFSISTYENQLKKDLVHNVLQNNSWGCFRHIELNKIETKVQVEHAYIDTLTVGDLASLTWIEGPLKYHETDRSLSNLCSVYYASLNFRDVMLATGKLPPGNLPYHHQNLGFEFSGRDSRGRRVMGIVPSRGLATTVLATTGFLWEVPEKWSLEEAATIPVAYTTSYYALIVRGRLEPGESLLVHSGAGGVGQASIAIALLMGCTVFTTAGSPAKRAFLRKTFPNLDDDNIGNSRDSSFEAMVMARTDGRGVDCVLNSLPAHQVHASARCLAVGGRFLEIGKKDATGDSQLGSRVFLRNTTFHGIVVDALFHRDSSAKRQVVKLVSEGIAKGVVRPLPRTVYEDRRVEEAFRFMAAGEHIGKVMIQIRSEDARSPGNPSRKTVSANGRSYMNPKKSYVLVGGLGDFGLELADWLISRGATKIVLSSGAGIQTGYQSLCIRRWRELGIEVRVSTSDATSPEGCEGLLMEAMRLGPIGGVFHLAGLMRDALMVNQCEENFDMVCKSKGECCRMLDAASRLLAPSLDHFFISSSIACGRGRAGQSNYSFADSVIERIVESRREAGLPGTAIQWGAMTGMMDSPLQNMYSCSCTMDAVLRQPHAVVASTILPERKETAENTHRSDLTHKICGILGIKDAAAVSPSATFKDMGMDSLMTAEIKQVLEHNYNTVLSTREIRALSFARLFELNLHNAKMTTTHEATQ